MPEDTDRICAVVTAYFPDTEFEQQLASVLAQVDVLVVIDNTPGGGCRKRLAALFAHAPHGSVIEMGENTGIAAALNKGLEHAIDHNCDLMLSLDQDSRCYPDMVNSLLAVRNEKTLRTAVIGGNYFDTRNSRYKVPVEGNESWVSQKTVITSGCIIDTRIAQKVGGFREDYFIDQVDHEFCLRMRAHGYKVVITRKPVMSHSVGEVGGPRLPAIGVLPGQSPLRKYYVARNSLTTIAGYLRIDPIWSMTRLARLVLGLFLTLALEKNGWTKAKAFFLGCLDAARQRMGPCPWKSLTGSR